MTLSTDDIVEIQQLAAAYCHLIDSAQGDRFAKLFSPDGVFEIVDLSTATGHEELAANAEMFTQFMPGGRHIVQNQWIEGDGDTATMRCYLSNVRVGERPEAIQTGRYVDDVVRTAEGWRFARRTLTLDGPLV